MSFGKLYGYPANPRTRACLVAAEYAGVQVELVNANPVEGLSAEYKQKYPLAKIPAFEGTKVTLTQSVAIATYLASQSDQTHLLGSSKEEAAQIQMYAQFANMEILQQLGGWFAPLIGRAPYNKAAVEQAKTNANKALDVLEKELADRTFLVGERISLADIFVASILGRGFEFVLDSAWRKEHTNTVRYFQTVANQPQFLKVNGGEPKLCETAAVYTPPKKEAAKPKEQPKAAAAAAPAKKEAAAEDDEAAPAPKPKHPCEALGPAKSFPLDEFKRQYSNNDTPVAFKWFEEHYDPQEYSLWQAKYKYNDELGQPYQSNNLITGFHSRLEGSRKYIFGNGAVYGSQGNSAIMGVYVIRGSNHEDVFSVAPDWESYDFSPLDLAKDRQLILDSWAWEGSYNGLEHSGQAKTFK